MARFDAAGTGYNPEASGPKSEPSVRWRAEPEGFSGGVASPILVGDTVFAVGGSLVALDRESGETRFAAEGSYRSSPARAAATAYATDTLAVTAPRGVFGLNAGGGLRVLGRALGVERWHGPGREPSVSVFGPPTAVPPVAVGETVFAAVPGVGEIGALDASSGRVRWRASPGSELRRPAVRDGVVFAVNWPGHATAFDAGSGEPVWERELDEQMVLAPTATADGVVVPGREGVSMLEAADGSTRWHVDHDGNATAGAAAVAEGRVFVASAGPEGSLLALDGASGEELWSTPFRGETALAVADGVVYAPAGSGGGLVALDAGTGEVLWRFDTRFPASTPAVGDGVVYVVSHGSVLALEAGA